MASIQQRISKDGKVSYRVQIRIKGFPPKTACFEHKVDAKRWANAIETEIAQGRLPCAIRNKRRTFAEMIEKYKSEVLTQKDEKHRIGMTTLLSWWDRELGKYALANVTPAVIADARNRLAADPRTPRTENLEKRGDPRKRSNATINRYLAALSVVYSVACREWGWVDDNPLRKVRKPPEPRGRVRFLSDEERARLLAACLAPGVNPLLYPAVVIALATGAGLSEIMNLTWDRVDLARGRAILDDTKNGVRRALHLTAHALYTVQSLSQGRRQGESLLFPGEKPGKPIELRKAWNNALDQAEIKNFRFHDLRHSAASYLAMNGATLAEIAEILGHKTLAMVKRYTHLRETHTRNVVALMTERIFCGVADKSQQPPLLLDNAHQPTALLPYIPKE